MEKKIEYINGSGLFIEGLTCTDIKRIDKYRKVKTLTLRKVKGATITKYKSSAIFEDSEYVDETGDYRVYYEITAYYGNGKSETTSKYKYDTY